MSATGNLETALTKHLVYLQRYSGGLVNTDVKPAVNKLAKDIQKLINGNLTDNQLFRLTSTLNQIEELVGDTMGQMQLALEPQYQELAEYEAGFQLKAVGNVMTVPLTAISAERISAIVSDTPMTLLKGGGLEQLTFDQAITQFSGSTSRRINQSIRDKIRAGTAAGNSIASIARQARAFVEGTTQTEAQTLVRTFTNHVSQQAMNDVVSQNDDLFTEERWSSTLDGRTSLVCIGRDGKKYAIGQGPYPPAHFACRSRRLPYIPEQYAIVKTSERASMDGPVDSRVTYGGWLSRQSKSFQNDVLGPERAKLFRSGKVSVDKFTDQDGATLTLVELKEKEGIALGA